jgi:adenylate kinase
VRYQPLFARDGYNKVNVALVKGRIHSLNQYPTGVREGCRIALSGTPGTGKTTIGALLAKENFKIITLETLAEKYECLGEVDVVDNSKPIDMKKLKRELEISWTSATRDIIIIDGHLSHQLPCDEKIILRCRPDILQARLEKRDYTKEKVLGNVEWELIGGPWNDKEDSEGWLELDTTELSKEDTFEYIRNWIIDDFKPTTRGTEIDWIGVMEE